MQLAEVDIAGTGGLHSAAHTLQQDTGSRRTKDCSISVIVKKGHLEQVELSPEPGVGATLRPDRGELRHGRGHALGLRGHDPGQDNGGAPAHPVSADKHLNPFQLIYY